MAVYYLDTSALVKRYAQENGTAWISALTDPAAGHDLYTVRLTGPEMIAALFRKARMGQVRLDEVVRSANNFREDWRRQYQIVEVTDAVADRAMELAERHALRGYDAVHLAAAMALQAVRQTLQLPPLTFISSDAQQLQAAEAEGLLIQDPNQYPRNGV
jgi:predicted nucleic acid-binding protein